ncbi:MAG: tRNA uridine-5-carboxymethylaminomethyl(34) synthesis GTPase MnmE [Chitinophagaceae bacterium]|nr:MAG: tRNA uridine-5-carboxymethylaminomethyl(34) synthesis GTPase MnmE [Chitinophagaceae bacterium]
MQEKLMGWNDTIVALATPPGIGAIGVIRLTGERAIEIAAALFPSKNLTQVPTHTLHVGLLKEGNTVLDEVVASVFIAPKSYTGENSVEFSTHGSPFIQQQVIDACIRKGARLAKPGEFTQRAFLNGKLDLTQAEAVADLIASNTKASHKTALNNIRGGFSADLKMLREELIKFSALIELELDFSQEDVAFADRAQLNTLIKQLIQSTQQLLHSFQLGNVIKNGVSIAIIGKPNAGKSTLLNALLNENRAIVSEIAGTTRDTIEEVINIDGILFRLIDTAGIRQHTSDVIEKLGVEKSREKIKSADRIIYLFDAVTESEADVQLQVENFEKENINYFLVANKIDELTESKAREKYSKIENIIFIAAKENKHIQVLKEKMIDAVLSGQVLQENTIITNARHFHALNELNQSLEEIIMGLNENLTGDLLAIDIRKCLYYLGTITGEITNDDQLDFIFSKFCIGK